MVFHSSGFHLRFVIGFGFRGEAFERSCFLCTALATVRASSVCGFKQYSWAKTQDCVSRCGPCVWVGAHPRTTERHEQSARVGRVRVGAVPVRMKRARVSSSTVSMHDEHDESQLLERPAGAHVPAPLHRADSMLPQALHGHILFVAVFAAVLSLVASPSAKINSFTPSFAGLSMPVSYASLGDGMPHWLGRLRDLADSIALPSVAVLWGCNDVLRPPSISMLRDQLARLAEVWFITGLAFGNLRALGVPGARQFAFSADATRVAMQGGSSQADATVPELSMWIFAGQSCAPLIALALLRLAFVRWGLVAHPVHGKPRGASPRIILLGVIIATIGIRLPYLAVCPLWSDDISVMLVTSLGGQLHHALTSLLLPTATLLVFYFVVPAAFLPIHLVRSGLSGSDRARRVLKRTAPFLTLVGLLVTVTTCPKGFGDRHLRMPPTCPSSVLSMTFANDLADLAHAGGLLLSLILALPANHTTRLSENAGQMGITPLLLHAPLWPLLRPMFMLSDAAGTLFGIVVVGDPNDARGVSAEDLHVERLRLAYLALTTLLATLITINTASAVQTPVDQLYRAVRGRTVAPDEPDEDEGIDEESDKRRTSWGEEHAIQHTSPRGGEEVSDEERVRLRRAGLCALASILAAWGTVFLLLQRVVNPLLAEEAVMPIEDMRLYFCSAASLRMCGGIIGQELVGFG